MAGAAALGHGMVPILVLCLVCTALAMLLMFYFGAPRGSSRAAAITCINLVVATLLGVAPLDERPGVGGYAAFGLILFGSWLADARRLCPRLKSNAPTAGLLGEE